jgi:hypothetical protein
VSGPRVSSQNKKITAARPRIRPNSQHRRCGFTNYRRPWHWPTCQRLQANRARAAQNFPHIFTIVPMKFQLLHKAVKGTPVVSLNTVTHAIHIRLLARHVHNTCILPTAAATHPARLRRSLPAADLLFSIPTTPCVTTVTRTRLLVCGHTSGQPKDGWRGSIDIIPSQDDEPTASGHEPTWIRPLRPSREQLLHSRQRLVLLEPQLSHWPPKSAIYSCQCGLIRETCLDSSSLIDWLWI